MPFIEKWRRDVIEKHGLEGLAEVTRVTPGDRCYVFYKKMVDAWNDTPRWTTAHTLLKDLMMDKDYDTNEFIACYLAWHVFFNIHVMPYEQQKRKENGDI